jgi:hypothetical protein
MIGEYDDPMVMIRFPYLRNWDRIIYNRIVAITTITVIDITSRQQYGNSLGVVSLHIQ